MQRVARVRELQLILVQFRITNLPSVRSCHAHCPAPFQATATMLLPGEVTATAWLLAAYTVTSSPLDSALTR